MHKPTNKIQVAQRNSMSDRTSLYIVLNVHKADE
jgi:hypothetical protein